MRESLAVLPVGGLGRWNSHLQTSADEGSVTHGGAYHRGGGAAAAAAAAAALVGEEEEVAAAPGEPGSTAAAAAEGRTHAAGDAAIAAGAG